LKFIIAEQFIIKQEKEHVLIPYFNETDLCSQLQRINLEHVPVRLMESKPQEMSDQTLILPNMSGCITITWMNLGSIASFDLDHLVDLFRGIGMRSVADCQILLEGLQFPDHTVQKIIEAIVRAMYQGAYSFSKDKLSKAINNCLFSIRDELKDEKEELTVTLISSKALQDSINKAVNYGKCINYARMLGDLPNNYLHVKEFAEYMKDLAEEYKLPYEILGKKELEELHSGGILGVNAGSEEEPKLITIYYEGSKDAPVTALIGKGVMFDSGGYHLKSMAGMQGMKYDMCGAANMAAALEIAVRQKSKRNILLIIPAVENVIGPSACKMGDVLTTMSGKTVEVCNIDAEGRLILCDAITYAIKKGADRIIDLATLTYSCQRALGDEISGLFSNDDDYYKAFMQTTEDQCEKVWRLPLDASYHKLLHRTQTADLINYAPDHDGGAGVAACFLEEFLDRKIPWIHLDVVGTAVNRGEDKTQSVGATGVLTASIAAFLE
jgi:leucyl aminopeptidase